MTMNCPRCGLALTEPAAHCPLCNERLIRFQFRTRYLLTALLALEIAAALIVLT